MNTAVAQGVSALSPREVLVDAGLGDVSAVNEFPQDLHEAPAGLLFQQGGNTP